ncbi:MAG: sensor histidine kinase [Pseudomonadota bacterium]
MQLRHLLFAAFSITAVIPVVIFASWPESKALQMEIDAVEERHQVIAENLATGIEDFQDTVSVTFDMLARNVIAGRPPGSADKLLENLGFRHLCIVERTTGTVVETFGLRRFPCPGVVPASRLALFNGIAVPGVVTMSGVLATPSGEPALYIVLQSGDYLAVGAVRTDAIVRKVRSVSFGQAGHAAVFDQHGLVISHPNPNFQRERRDLSTLEPVRRATSGQRGFSRFYSPAMQTEMIAGFAPIGSSGWGVMVPQPYSELQERANQLSNAALSVIALGLLAAALASWKLSGYLTRPLHAVATAAGRMANGEEHVRVRALSRIAPRELHELRATFNKMAVSVEDAAEKHIAARSKAETASEAKSRLLANVSHELRTPLNAIIGFSEMLLMEIHGKLGAQKYSEYVHDIRDSGRHLLALISDILDMSKIEAGQIDAHPTQFSISEAIDVCVRMFRMQAEKKMIDLTVDVPDVLPLLEADRRLFQQMIINLLSNAVKFTPARGRITVSAHYWDIAGFAVSVIDTGCGIPEDDLSRVLEPFQQGGDTYCRHPGGTGLGLPLVKALAEIHGGRLIVRSRVGGGTEATLLFPASRRQPDSVQIKEAPMQSVAHH